MAMTTTMIFEKVENYGTDSLHDKEILMALTGVKEDSAENMLNEYGSLMRVCKNAPYFEPTLTKRQFQKLSLLNEVIRRKPIDYKGIKVDRPYLLAKILIDMIGYEEKEHFCITILDTKNHIIKIENISIGSLNASVVHPREVFAEAIKHRANSIILGHNHPSGDPSPSTEDINLTHRLIDAGEILGIRVLDHIIVGGVGGEKYISLKERNII